MFRSIDQFYGLPLSVGIFAYLNYHVPRTRREILEILLKGLQRLEYRGYDSAGKKTHLLLTLVEWHCCSDTEACVCVICLFVLLQVWASMEETARTGRAMPRASS